MGLENRVLNFAGAQEKWRRGSGPNPGKSVPGEATLGEKNGRGDPSQTPHKGVFSKATPGENGGGDRGHSPRGGGPGEAITGKMEEGTEVMAQPGEGPARPPREKKEEGTEAKVQPGADRARRPQDKWVGRWPKRLPKGG